MDIYGGKGIQMGLNNYLVFLYMVFFVLIIVEGVNIFICNLMIFGQGVICCYFYVFEEMMVVVEFDFQIGLN